MQSRSEGKFWQPSVLHRRASPLPLQWALQKAVRYTLLFSSYILWKIWLWIAMKMVEKINYGNGFYKIKNSAANQPFIDRPRSARWNAKPKNFLIIKMDFATIGAALHFTNSSQDRWSRRPWMVPDLPFSCVHCLSINLIGKWQWWWRVQTINSCEYQFFPNFCWHSGYTLRLVWYC